MPTTDKNRDSILEYLPCKYPIYKYHSCKYLEYRKSYIITYRSIRMIEEVVQYIENGGLRQDEFLQVLRMEVMSVHVDCW